MAGGSGSASNGALQAQLDALKEQVSAGFGDLKAMMQSFDDKLEKLTGRVEGVERKEAVCQPMLTARLINAEQTVAQHAEKLKHLDAAVTRLAQTNTILQWLLGIFTALIIAGALAFVGRLWQVMWP